MKATRLAIPDVIRLEPRVLGDDRGVFFESFNQRLFRELTGLDRQFVQDNHSVSARGVLRGLHYQLPPNPQGKLVRVARGEIFDVAVDIRRGSPTFGRWVGEILSAENHAQLWVPEGFAHGFLALTEGAEVLYKTTDFYAPASERCIIWDDPEIGIVWPSSATPRLSPKDALGRRLAEADVFELA
ncbi:MAG: dTDP-4-dehydrorhamnose 3,5-epimerase [Devosia nanyangense]|jgi:dTDP-4-dehydrorhamnose 3,5-epimerase|nr:dTDP-4-dehydrorhamnose 3,5-epimerase [Devosia nanyangense]